MIGFIITMIVIGIIAGYLARLLVPGRDPMGFVQTVVLGVVGSFVGGFLGYVLFDKDIAEGGLQPSGIVGSIIGAVIALLDLQLRPRTAASAVASDPEQHCSTARWRSPSPGRGASGPGRGSERPHRA